MTRLKTALGAAIVAVWAVSAAAHDTTSAAAQAKAAHGVASWYGPGFHGRKTANGERFDQNALTAAHKTLPFGTKVRVTNASNGKSVVVRVNDRGPFVGKRVLDLSRGAAAKIGLIKTGVGRIRMEVLPRA